MRSPGAEPDGSANDDSDAISGNGEVEDDTMLVVSGDDDEYSSDDDGASAEEAEQLSSPGTEDDNGDEEKLKPASPRARTDGASRSPLVAASSPQPPPDDADEPSAPRSASGRDPRLTPLEIFCGCVMLTLRFGERTQAAAPPSVTTEAKTDAVEHTGGVGIAVTTTSNVVGAKAQTEDQGPGIISNNLLLGGEQSAAKVPRKRRRSISKEDREEATKKVRLVKATKEKRPYVCKHCGEEFPTHQALGGHMAGHHREKKVAVLDSMEDAASLSVADPHQGMAVGQSQRKGKHAKKGGDGDKSWSGGASSLSSSGRLHVVQTHGAVPHVKLQVVRRSNTGSTPAVVPAAAADGDLRQPPLDLALNIRATEQD